MAPSSESLDKLSLADAGQRVGASRLARSSADASHFAIKESLGATLHFDHSENLTSENVPNPTALDSKP